MVNDSMVAVRVRACELLGSMRGVQPSFLLQTLDKKLMSQLKVRQSGYDIRHQKVWPANGKCLRQQSLSFSSEAGV
jgi:hypothetical protein